VTPLNESVQVRQCERVAARVVDGKAVVVVIDAQKLHVLNAVGTRVWELADGRTVGAIAQAITREFAVDETRARSDVLRFVEELAAVGAVELAVSGTTPEPEADRVG
jgi:hypothetical protein